MAPHLAMSAGYNPDEVRAMTVALEALLGLGFLWGLSRAWCSRVERRTVVSPGESFWRVYRRLLWSASWRSFVITVAIGLLLAFCGQDARDAGQKMGAVFGLYPFLFIVIAATSWRATTRLFRYTTSAATSATSLVGLHRSRGSLHHSLVQSPPELEARSQIKKLNGWQRAWVVLAIVWAALVLLSGSPPESPSRLKERQKEIPQGNATKHADASGQGYWVDVSDDDMARLEELDNKIKTYPHDIALYVIDYAAGWAGPLIAIYLLGMGVAWIRAGFRRES